jgi:hypothetical protein
MFIGMGIRSLFVPRIHMGCAFSNYNTLSVSGTYPTMVVYAMSRAEPVTRSYTHNRQTSTRVI